MTTAPKLLSLLLFTLSVLTVSAAEHPYNETADAKAEIKQAEATATNTPIVLVFGANWCPDCLALNKAMTRGASAALLSQDFKIVKIDVGHFDKNKDVAQTYDVPLEKGIPAVAIISPENQVLYVTKEGELSNARKMSDDGIYQFFKRVTASAKAK